ncbi:hypothetical protein [Pseudofrankia sp. DC12]|uniref:hypothetical protein n=1 Tax=Pseudofrankia sp. DC12 TaxID=683315 RepID=UPI0005F89415|nr:hypothetical protein [Pseudofrankia sp. DC12]
MIEAKHPLAIGEKLLGKRRPASCRSTGCGGPRHATVAPPSAIDLLDVTDEVDAPAALIAASTTEPPFAIAVLGEWGAGDSTVLKRSTAGSNGSGRCR